MIHPPEIRLVILESPFAGPTPEAIAQNLAYAHAALRDSLLRNEAPMASHCLYTGPGVLDDTNPAERALGIAAGLAWGPSAQATVVYTDLGISRGMSQAIDRARAEHRPVEMRTIPGWGQLNPVQSTGQPHPMAHKVAGVLWIGTGEAAPPMDPSQGEPSIGPATSQATPPAEDPGEVSPGPTRPSTRFHRSRVLAAQQHGQNIYDTPCDDCHASPPDPCQVPVWWHCPRPECPGSRWTRRRPGECSHCPSALVAFVAPETPPRTFANLAESVLRFLAWWGPATPTTIASAIFGGSPTDPKSRQRGRRAHDRIAKVLEHLIFCRHLERTPAPVDGSVGYQIHMPATPPRSPVDAPAHDHHPGHHHPTTEPATTP